MWSKRSKSGKVNALLLSLQICVRILQAAGQVNAEEWQFFLRGGQVRLQLASKGSGRRCCCCCCL